MIQNQQRVKRLAAPVERLALRQLRKLTKCRVPAAAALKRVELSILLVDDKQMRVLNRRWRKKDKTTDVLSFPLISRAQLLALGRRAKKKPSSLEPWLLGDIIISIPTAIRQAAEKEHSLQKELAWLCAHGILHLLGFDHELGIRQARVMRAWERQLLTR